MAFSDAANLEDLQRIAKRRLPKIVYDFIEGGVEDETGIDRNLRAFREQALVPHYLVDVTTRDQSATVFGRTYAGPFGITPTGLAGLFRPGADRILAEAARDADLPFIMSTMSNLSIEDLGRIAPEHGWFQLYPARDKAISEDMIRRAADAGLSTLAVTVDVPVASNRERNRRNGFGRPLRMSLATRLDALRYPSWLAGYLTHGMPMLTNWQPYAKPGPDAGAIAAFVFSQTQPQLTWADMESFRRLWPRNFVVKGIMHRDDAVRAASLGADGVIVSNHGARQLDRAPSSLEALPGIVDAVGDRMTVMLDSGIRRGADALTALCLGARFVFLGRATLYGAVAGGKPGAVKAIELMRREIDLTMGQIGCPSLDQLGEDFLWRDRPDERRNARV